MKLEKANILDAKAIAKIHTESWRNTYNKVLSEKYLKDTVPNERREIWEDRLSNPKPNQNVIVAKHEGQIVGFVCAYLNDNPKWGSYLDNLHVIKDYRARGIGKSLFMEIASWCFSRKPNNGLCLLVNQDNKKAQGFYIRLGARNAEKGVWNAPDGSVVPTYWFVWENLENITKNG